MSRERSIYKLDLDRLQEVLDYDPETGVFVWLMRLSPRGGIGKRAGCVNKSGYRRIAIDKKVYMASHLAWLYFYEEPPEEGKVVDFVNLDKDDTRICNLRLATYEENARNQSLRADSSTGLKGAVRFNSPRNKKRYRSSIRVGGKKIHLGQFDTPEEAHEAYSKKVKELHGEFGRTK